MAYVRTFKGRPLFETFRRSNNWFYHCLLVCLSVVFSFLFFHAWLLWNFIPHSYLNVTILEEEKKYFSTKRPSKPTNRPVKRFHGLEELKWMLPSNVRIGCLNQQCCQRPMASLQLLWRTGCQGELLMIALNLIVCLPLHSSLEKQTWSLTLSKLAMERLGVR